MGCCCPKLSQPDASETTNLLRNPVRADVRNYTSLPVSNHSTPTPNNKRDAQSALNKILHRTANDIIDISAVDGQNVEPHEYIERSKKYRACLTQLVSYIPPPPNPLRLPPGVMVPQAVLQSQPVSNDDVRLITTYSQRISQAVRSITVQPNDRLVVPFVVS